MPMPCRHGRKWSHYLSQAAIICLSATPCHADNANWKQDNEAAIQAMRADKFEESEQLFHKALDECKLEEDRNIVKRNLTVLLQKLGRISEARQLQGEVSVNSRSAPDSSANNATPSNTPVTTGSAAATTQPGAKLPSQTKQIIDPSKSSASYKELGPYLKQLDDEIQAADAKGDLETLQSLFQKKAEVVRMRDHGESIDYAYLLHFRAQVFRHMHKDTQADALEAYAVRVRDAIRMYAEQQKRSMQQQQQIQLQQQHFQPVPFTWDHTGGIVIPQSKLQPFSLNFDPGSPVNLPNLNETFSNPAPAITNSQRNAIDRNTPSATSVLNAERKNFGK